MKKCNSCGCYVPEDSNFCPYCGSINIVTEPTVTPINSGIRMETFTQPVTQPFTQHEDKYKSKFKWSIIISMCLLVGLCFSGYQWYRYYSLTSSLTIANQDLSDQLSDTETELNKAQRNANTYKTKSGYYDIFKQSASSTSNKNFFVSNTVLRNPVKTRVVFYINYSGQYTISWESDYGVTTTSGNTSSGLVYIDVTFTGTGVKKIVCTNNVNDEKITIYCIGSS